MSKPSPRPFRTRTGQGPGDARVREVGIHNAFTVDVEEWFHICGAEEAVSQDRWESFPSRVLETTRILLEILDRRRVRATFFILGWVAERYPDLVGEIALAQHEIASHGHAHRRAYELGPEAFESDLVKSIQTLEQAGAGSIDGYRAPEWSINDRSLWALDILARKGFRFDSSMTPLRLIGNPRYPPRPHPRPTRYGTLMEFPPLVSRRLGQNIPLGGGWGLRMSSPRTVLREIEKRNKRGEPVALFVHPWELDPSPPSAALPWKHRFGHYFRLEGFRQRLEEVLQGADFEPMGDVLFRKRALGT